MTTPERQPLPYAWAEIKARLQRRVPDLAAALGVVDTRVRGGLMTPLNPTRTDRRAGSFVIWTAGDGAGAWKDYATDEAGDVFQLIAYLAGIARGDTMSQYWWALEFLGLGKGEVRTSAQATLERERYARERAAREARDLALEDSKAAELRALWLGLPPFMGTVAEVYLREARAIPLGRLPKPPGALRFEARADHFDPETGEVTVWPALTSIMTRGSKGVGLHRTFLTPDGGGKAPVTPAKKMYGALKGAAIRLTSGAGGYTAAKAAELGKTCPLMIGEGIETTLTCAAAMPGYRAWAPGSLALMASTPWPDCASAVILLQDTMDKPETLAAFARVEAWWRGQANGRVVKVVGSAVGSDFNDWVRA